MPKPKGKILDLAAIRTARKQPRRTYLDAYLESFTSSVLRNAFFEWAERLADRIGSVGFPRFQNATLQELIDGWFEAANGEAEADAMLVEAVLRGRAVGMNLKEYCVFEAERVMGAMSNRHQPW